MTEPQNHLLTLLPSADRQRLLDASESIDWLLGEVLDEAGQSTAHAYFPVDGFASLIARIDAHPGIEVGMVGREGLLGLHLSLGVIAAPLRAVVQGPGSAWRIPEAAFADELARSLPLRSLLKRYLHVRMVQLASSAVCLRYHLIAPRLARWLLMSQDRAHSDRFLITQEFLAYMLGVRRVGVTVAASALQRAGLIEYHRGHLTVRDRSGLEAAACGCYAADRRVFEQFLS